MTDYHVEVYDPTGTTRLAVIRDFIALSYARAEMKVGAAALTVPPAYRDLFILGDDVRVDARLLFYRALPGSTPYLDMETEWLVQEAHEVQDASGQTNIVLNAVDGNFILDTRIIAYAVDSAQATKTATAAGDVCKAIVRENLGALATDTTRDLTTYLTVQADMADGETVTKAASRRKVLTTLQEIADMSAQLGTYLSFDVVSKSPGNLEFRTYAGYRGVDRRASSSQQLLVGRDFGNLSDFNLGYVHTGEVTYCYAGGLGNGATRPIGEASDAARMAVTPWRRIENFREGLNTADDTTLDDEAYSVVRANRPKLSVTGTLAQTPGFLYGLHFH